MLQMGPLNRRQLVKDRVFRAHALNASRPLPVLDPSPKTIARAFRASRSAAAPAARTANFSR
jgi:hypothetical protein